MVRATVTITGPTGSRLVAAVRQGDGWLADTNLRAGERAVIRAGHLVDEFGESNGTDITLANA